MRYSVKSCTTICVLLLGLVTTSLSSPHSSGSSSTSVAPASGGGSTLKCTRYSGIKGPNPTCNDDPQLMCSGGCTGAIVASQCMKEGDPSAQAAQLVCTISYSQPSLDRGVCINDQGTFVCQGIPVGEASESSQSFHLKPPDRMNRHKVLIKDFLVPGLIIATIACTGCALIVGDPRIANTSSPGRPTNASGPEIKTSSSTSPPLLLPGKPTLFLAASKLLGLFGILAVFL